MAIDLKLDLDLMIPELYVWNQLYNIYGNVLHFYPKEDSKFLKIWNLLKFANYKKGIDVLPLDIFQKNPCEQKFINISRKMDIVVIFELYDEMEEDAFYFQLKYGA